MRSWVGQLIVSNVVGQSKNQPVWRMRNLDGSATDWRQLSACRVDVGKYNWRILSSWRSMAKHLGTVRKTVSIRWWRYFMSIDSDFDNGQLMLPTCGRTPHELHVQSETVFLHPARDLGIISIEMLEEPVPSTEQKQRYQQCKIRTELVVRGRNPVALHWWLLQV